MRIRTRLLGAVLIVILLLAAFYYAMSGQKLSEQRTIFGAGTKTTIRLWYTDEALTDYLTAKVVEYNNLNTKSRVELSCVSGLEYLEEINRASLNQDSYPDVFITTHDNLEKAYLAGLAGEIDDQSFLMSEANGYSDAALNSVKYQDKYIAYPYYFETSSLVYNKTYLEDEAKARIQAELDAAEGEAAQAAIDAQEPTGDEEEAVSEDVSEESSDASLEMSDAELESAVAQMLPKTIEDILVFADNYNAPEAVESVFEWDVTDVFYNYFFVGNYLNIGGPAGDDISQIDVYNENTINCMSFYQQLNQFFAIDEEQVNYEKVVQDFIDGKTVFTVATSDVVSKIEEAKAEGNCSFEYGVATMPALNDTYLTRTMSVTDCLVINGYSEHEKEANSFARFLCSEDTDNMYTMSGKLLARSGVNYENASLPAFVDVYANSVPMPKLMATSNFWVQLEIAIANIWDGGNVNDTLRELSEKVKLQIGGEEVHEEVLPDATVTITEAE